MHHMPCTITPKVMMEGLMMETIKRLNVLPVQNGTSSTHSPSVLLSKLKLWHNKHSQHSLGECAQVGLSNQTVNVNVEMTIDGMCICPSGDTSGA